MVWNQVLKNPESGTMFKDMNFNPVTGKSDYRFPASHGFQKMEVIHKLPDGQSITIHYQYNQHTNKAYDMKITTPKPKPSWSK